MKKQWLIPAGVALVMAFVSSKWAFLKTGLCMIPWGMLAVYFGLLAQSKSDALKLGFVYGFCQAFFFLWVDHNGATKLSQFFLLVVIISGLGLLAGLSAAVAARLSFWCKQRLAKKTV